jgi:hypothetical protein
MIAPFFAPAFLTHSNFLAAAQIADVPEFIGQQVGR